MSEDTKTRVSLTTEDLARARRLTEEAKSRLYEVSLIVGRALGRDFPAGSFVSFEQRQSEAKADQTIEVVVIALPDGTFGCYQDPPGICVHPC
jgi:hypothetical protein